MQMQLRCWQENCESSKIKRLGPGQVEDVSINKTFIPDQSQSYFTTGGLPPVRLCDKPFETHDQ
jgi:hypothetical protein